MARGLCTGLEVLCLRVQISAGRALKERWCTLGAGPVCGSMEWQTLQGSVQGERVHTGGAKFF